MAVKYFAWDDATNGKLTADRGIGFEDIVFHIDSLEHPNVEDALTRSGIAQGVRVALSLTWRSTARWR